jgi:7-carboxy-7-deazaguanine synthase
LSLKINEIFYSLQGESSFSGYPCIFIRLSGCNLRCSYCDTRYAYEEGAEMEILEIIKQAEAYPCSLVEITGGEPLIQEETPILIRFLLDRGYQVLLETNGTQDISTVDVRCVRIMDIKGPSSGEMKKNDLRNLKKLTEKDEVKFIIGDRADYEYAMEILKHVPPKNPVHFSPLFGVMPYRTLAGWILEDRLSVRMHLQLHKVIWPSETRGV